MTKAPKGVGLSEGDRVFVPGANCYQDVRGLFGGAAKHLIVPAARVVKLDQRFDDRGVLIALAATAYHAIAGEGATVPELIIGHGIVGRLIARIAVALGADAPLVWETNDTRREGALDIPLLIRPKICVVIITRSAMRAVMHHCLIS